MLVVRQEIANLRPTVAYGRIFFTAIFFTYYIS